MRLTRQDLRRLGLGHLIPAKIKGTGTGKPSRPRRPPPSPQGPCGRWTMEIPGWRPTFDNELKRHPVAAHRLKQRDARVIATAAIAFGVPPATRRRRVSLVIRNRFGNLPDDTAPYKSLLDALVGVGLLVDDSREWCEIDYPPCYDRGEKLTIITLEDVDDVE